MRMEIRDESKTVELWLTREERDDLAFRESLKPMYQKYKTGYKGMSREDF